MGNITANPTKGRRVSRRIAAVIDLTVASGVINAGDLLYKTTDKVASLNTPGSSNANAAACVGVAMGQYPVAFTDGITGSPIPPNDPNVAFMEFAEDGDHLFNTTAGETYHAYTVVYLGADGRTISTVSSGTKVGYVSPDQRQSTGLSSSPSLLPITGAAGVQVYIHIQPALA